MMKKIYVNPALNVVQLKIKNSILIGSDPEASVNTGKSGDPSGFDAHGDDFDWDDEEEY